MSIVSAKAHWEEGNGEYLLHAQFDTKNLIEP
jgi:hypothetical protein